jgi:hypothetical protein
MVLSDAADLWINGRNGIGANGNPLCEPEIC